MVFVNCRNHRLGCKARGGSDARVRGQMMIAKQVATSNPFCRSSTFRFFLQKKGFFRFCGRDPSKMTILAPSRKTVRIGLYREGRKGPKSTFFGWSVFGVFGIFKILMILQKCWFTCSHDDDENVENVDRWNLAKNVGLCRGTISTFWKWSMSDDDDEKKRCWRFLKIMKMLGMGSRQDFRPLHDFKNMTLFFKKKKKI